MQDSGHESWTLRWAKFYEAPWQQLQLPFEVHDVREKDLVLQASSLKDFSGKRRMIRIGSPEELKGDRKTKEIDSAGNVLLLTVNRPKQAAVTQGQPGTLTAFADFDPNSRTVVRDEHAQPILPLPGSFVGLRGEA